MRREISKFGVGQAAIDMSFQTSMQFPEVFILDRIIGEVPLDVYTITMADILTDSELADPDVQKEQYLERIDLNSKFIQANVNSRGHREHLPGARREEQAARHSGALCR